MIDHYRNDDLERLEKEEIYSKAIRAGKRTYFFDVKATKGNDYFLTLTESKKRVEEDGSFYFEKHKIFLYKEDFEKFAEGLKDVIETIAQLQQGTKVNKERCIEEEVVSEVTYDKLAAITYEDL
ncbi:MAG: PUR family DNA/RNA-binding protein [Breznakibacter sp.]|nr:PUR family DNA/RNA-binding protein [Breznakibacter sp.]